MCRVDSSFLKKELKKNIFRKTNAISYIYILSVLIDMVIEQAIRITPESYRKLKIAAAYRKMTLKALIDELAAQFDGIQITIGEDDKKRQGGK